MPSPIAIDFPTTRDGTKLRRLRWQPMGTVRGRVLALHGLSCRAEDFAPLAARLVQDDIQLEAWDLRGQGSDPNVRRRGAWLEVEGQLEDLADLAESVGPEPLFLCGDSMGALLAIQAATRPEWCSRLAGLLLFVPVVGLAQKNPRWIKSVLRAAATVSPGLRLRPSWFVQGSADMPKLTRIDARQEELRTAPHRLGPLTVGFLARMGDLIEAALPAAPRIQAPLALFTAGHDVFVTVEQQEEFFNAIAALDKAHFHYPESYHQLLFDLDADIVVEAAARWINERLPARV